MVLLGVIESEWEADGGRACPAGHCGHTGEFRAKGPVDISLGHRPRNRDQPELSRAPTARFIAFDDKLLGGAM